MTPNKYRKNYEDRKESGFEYDTNMEHHKEADVESSSWVLITRQVPIMLLN